MKVRKFIDEFKLSTDKAKCVEKHITKKYLTFQDKTAVCKNIVELSMFKEVNGKKIFWIDTPIRYMMMVYAVIDNYTDIELGLDEERLEGFNLLEEYGIMSILSEVLESEYSSFNTILNMMSNDAEVNNNNLLSFLDNKVEAFNMFLEATTEGFKNAETDNVVEFPQEDEKV